MKTPQHCYLNGSHNSGIDSPVPFADESEMSGLEKQQMKNYDLAGSLK
tara:strand:- start:338 stop:481 length:144 start_codon:yes stop_codon:yes gene_type:complete